MTEECWTSQELIGAVGKLKLNKSSDECRLAAEVCTFQQILQPTFYMNLNLYIILTRSAMTQTLLDVVWPHSDLSDSPPAAIGQKLGGNRVGWVQFFEPQLALDTTKLISSGNLIQLTRSAMTQTLLDVVWPHSDLSDSLSKMNQSATTWI